MEGALAELTSLDGRVILHDVSRLGPGPNDERVVEQDLGHRSRRSWRTPAAVRAPRRLASRPRVPWHSSGWPRRLAPQGTRWRPREPPPRGRGEAHAGLLVEGKAAVDWPALRWQQGLAPSLAGDHRI